MIATYNLGSVGGIAEHVVVGFHLPSGYLIYFFANAEQGVTKTIQFSFVFALCGLDHDGAGYRE